MSVQKEMDAKISCQQGPRNRLCRAVGAGLRDAALLRAVQTCTAGLEPRHTAPSRGSAVREVTSVGAIFTSRGRGTGFAGPQAPCCETQPFCVPSKPALQARSRGTQPPRGAGSHTQWATVGAS